MPLTAVITHISRGSLHDGPGVRTVVYFKGCSLHCAWCHNPETIPHAPQILYAPVKCIHCGRCVAVCPQGHEIIGNDMVFHRENCSGCGRCSDACPSNALSRCGSEMSVDEVMHQVCKDRHYYASSGGGITLSGGECLLQPDFCAAVLTRCHQEGISTAIESALHVPYAHIQTIAPLVDTFFADLKLPDAQRHHRYTGQENDLILSNLRRLSHEHSNIILRIPLIPTVNDTPEDMDAFARVISTFGDGVTGVELLRYNYLAESKYQMVGAQYHAFGMDAQSPDTMALLAERLRASSQGRFPVYFRL